MSVVEVISHQSESTVYWLQSGADWLEWCSERDIILGNYSSLVRYLDWIIGKLPAVGSNMIPSHSSGSSFHSDISIRVLIHFKSSIATTMKIAIHSYFPHFVKINQFCKSTKKSEVH